MAFGLRTYDANGILETDIANRLFRILGTFRITTASGSYTVPNKTANTQLFIMQAGPYSNPSNSNAIVWLPVSLTISNNVVSWSYPSFMGAPQFSYIDVTYGEF